MYYDFTPIFFHRQEVLRWNGWGYKDSGFIIDDKHVTFQGKRYMAYVGHKWYTGLYTYMWGNNPVYHLIQSATDYW